MEKKLAVITTAVTENGISVTLFLYHLERCVNGWLCLWKMSEWKWPVLLTMTLIIHRPSYLLRYENGTARVPGSALELCSSVVLLHRLLLIASVVNNLRVKFAKWEMCETALSHQCELIRTPAGWHEAQHRQVLENWQVQILGLNFKLDFVISWRKEFFEWQPKQWTRCTPCFVLMMRNCERIAAFGLEENVKCVEICVYQLFTKLNGSV